MFGYNLGFSDPASPTMEWLIDLHHTIWFWLILIVVVVVWVLFTTFFRFLAPTYYTESKFFNIRHLIVVGDKLGHLAILEIIWTIIPILILIAIALPSFVLLYSMEELVSDEIGLTVKVIGNQWYWNYEIGNNVIESYLVNEEDLNIGDFRLLEVDNALNLPLKVNIRLLLTSSDVIHSWTVPSLGVKMDAVPGRLNETTLLIKRFGTFYGQCSEICGVNHGFMPIKVCVTDTYCFKDLV